MNQIEYEILVYCLEQGENTWLSEPCFTRDLKKSQKPIKKALKNLFENGLIKRKCGWYVNDKNQQICIFYYQICAKRKGGIEKI